jgi:hypothetical protein
MCRQQERDCANAFSLEFRRVGSNEWQLMQARMMGCGF